MARVDEMIDSLIRDRGDMSMFLLILQGIVERVGRVCPVDPLVVELGVRSGISTLAMLNGLERVGRGRLVSVDIEDCPGAIDAVARAGLMHRWQLRRDDSRSIPLSRDVGPCDVVLIDTSHEYQDTVDELEIWGSLVRLGGCVILHDLCCRDGVARAIDHFLDPSGFQHVVWRRSDIKAGPGLTILDKVVS